MGPRRLAQHHPGDLIDTDYIANAIRRAKQQYRLHSVAYDRYRATELVKDLNQEFGHHSDTQTNEWLEPYTQTTLHMTAPLREIEKLLLKRQLNHGRNPVIEWMNRNVVIYMDGNGNFKLDKKPPKKDRRHGGARYGRRSVYDPQTPAGGSIFRIRRVHTMTNIKNDYPVENALCVFRSGKPFPRVLMLPAITYQIIRKPIYMPIAEDMQYQYVLNDQGRVHIHQRKDEK